MTILDNPIFQTVLSGVFVLVISDIIQNYCLKPFQHYKEVIGKIDNALQFYANIVGNPSTFSGTDNAKECSAIFRSLSSDLSATRRQMSVRCRCNDKKISEVAWELIGLSNSMGKADTGESNVARCQKIREALDIIEFKG
ncbi:MAG: hypothetical protein WCV84_05270 [Patescibacteria group bacterium]